jgi:hypothetical protein
MKRQVIPFLLLVALLSGYAGTDDASIARYLDYRSLVRITKQRIDVPKETTMMCVDPRRVYGPHYKPGIHVYANYAALKAHEGGGESVRYPVGSLFVKEKFDEAGEAKPSVITVMEKLTDEGRVEDWKFTMIRMSDRAVVTEGFKVSCIDCHSNYRRSDYVSMQTQVLIDAYGKK